MEDSDLLCRTCLTVLRKTESSTRRSKNVPKWYDLFSSEDFVKKFLACTRLNAEITDGLPKILCLKCYKKINEIHAFQAMCKTSEVKLQELNSVSCAEIKTNILAFEPMLDIEDEKPFDKWSNPSENKMEVIEVPSVCTVDGLKVPASPFRIEKVKVEASEELVDLITTAPSGPILDDGEETADCVMPEEDSDEDGALDVLTRRDEDLFNDSASKVKKAQNSKKKKDTRKRIRDRKSEKPVKYLQCDKCPKRFISEPKFTAHKRKHDGLKAYPCTYAGCTHQFQRMDSLRFHMRKHTNSVESYECSQPGCERRYTNKQSLKLHVRREHGQGPELKKHCCEVCGKIFTSTKLLSDHRYIHKDRSELPYACDQPNCNRRFVKKDKLKDHLLRHAGIKNFICPECGMRKTTRNELTMHMKYHDKSVSYPCQFCSSVFHNPGNRKRHISIVHEGIRKYECRHCSQRFGKPDTCKYHEMTHTGEKPNVCKECGKGFIQPVALRTHMKIHQRQRQKQMKSTRNIGTPDSQTTGSENQYNS